MYRFPWYLTLVSTNHVSSNPGLKEKITRVSPNRLKVVLSSQELAKLRDQCEKQKRTIKKLEERVDQMSGKKRFNPEEAFSHAKKENLPLSVISNGTYTNTSTK